MLRYIFTLSLCVVIFITKAGNPDIKKGWEYFAQNELDKAKASFENALNSPEKAEAHLAISLTEAAAGDDEVLFHHYYEFYKNATNPTPYIEALWSMHGGERTDEELEFLETVVEKENGKLKAQAYQALGSHYFSIGKTSKAIDYYKQTGAIGTWSLVGEFENISESGFNKDYGALAHPEKDYIFKNKRGVDVKWFDLKMPRIDNWVDYEFHFYISNSIIYAQNFCNSPKDQEVQFRIGTSGSVKVWVNNKLMFSEAEERNNDLDTYIFPVELKRGNNRILIQIGSSEIDRSNFLLRITDSKGNNIDGLTYTTEVKPYPKNTYNYESKKLENTTEQFFQNKINENPDAIENYMILAQMYLVNDMTFSAKKILLEAKKRFPDCSYITFQLVDAYQRDQNRNGVSTYLEELKDKDPNNALAQELLYDEAVDIENYDEAEKIIEAIQKREGMSENVYNKKISLAGEKKEIENLVDLIEEAYNKFPDNYGFVLYKYYMEKDAKKNVSKAAKTLQKYLKNHYNEEAIRLLASYYFSSGDVSKGISTFEELVKNDPLATGYYSQLSGIYFSLGNYKKAEEYVRECLKIAPYVGTYHKTLAKTYSERGDKEKAIASFKDAIKYNPYDYEARELLRNAKGEKDIFSNFEETDVYDLYKNSPDASEYPEDNSIVLLDEIQNVVYDGGGSEERQILVVKVFNTSGVNRWKEYSIPIYSNQDGIVEKAEVLKKSGAKLEAERDGSYVVFSNLEEGDAIYLKYKLQNYYSGKLSNHFWDKHYFSYFFPILHSKYSLLVPASKKFHYKTENFELEPKITEIGDNKLYIWKQDTVPSLKYESYMPALPDVGHVLHLSSFEDWNFIAEWYADLAKAKAKVDFEVQETVNELFQDKENLSDMEKVKMIYEYIVNNIRYSSVSFIQSGLVPQKASRVISAKQGDCKDVSTLFVAMCKAEGIDANLVLVDTRDNGKKDMILPSIEFNHCIAKTHIGDKDYYVELTDDNLPFASGANTVDHVFALEIPGKTSSKVTSEYINAPNRVKNNIIRTSVVTFEGTTMKVEKENVKSGTLASSMRNTYENIGEETRFKEMQEAISYDFPNSKLNEVAFEKGLDDNNPEVEYKYAYSVPSIFTEISGLSIFKIPFADAYTTVDFLSREERKFPIELWAYFSGEHYEETLSIEIPSGKSLSEIPKPQVYKTKYFNYSLNFKLEGNQLKVTRKFDVLADRVPPSDYKAFKEAFGKVIKADDTRLAFK